MDAANAQRPRTRMPAIFAAERTLGRLAKWLRLMGFDTLSEIDYPRGSFLPQIGPQRVFLTRTQRLRDTAVGLGTIFIQANDPTQQAVELVRKAAIRREDLRPFSRCVRCNAGIEAVARIAVWRSVPDYVWNTRVDFSACPQCGRVYWKGSHTERALKMLEAILVAAEGG
jgi:uncharacterized protein with PIN domain